MNTFQIYSISSELLAIMKAIEEQGGEITPEQDAALIIGQEQLTTKSVDYGHFILNMGATAEAIDAEIERLQALKKTAVNGKERVSTALVLSMKALGIDKIETPTMRLSLRHTTATMIDDAEQIPDRFKTVKVEKVVNKTEIKKAIQAGEAVAGVHLQENVSLQIK